MYINSWKAFFKKNSRMLALVWYFPRDQKKVTIPRGFLSFLSKVEREAYSHFADNLCFKLYENDSVWSLITRKKLTLAELEDLKENWFWRRNAIFKAITSCKLIFLSNGRHKLFSSHWLYECNSWKDFYIAEIVPKLEGRHYKAFSSYFGLPSF